MYYKQTWQLWSALSSSAGLHMPAHAALLLSVCALCLHWLHKLAQCSGRAPQLASTPHLTWVWPLQCVSVAPAGSFLAACHSHCLPCLCQQRRRDGEAGGGTQTAGFGWGSGDGWEGRLFQGASGVAWSIKFTLWINDLQMIYKQVSVFESSFRHGLLTSELKAGARLPMCNRQILTFPGHW